MTISWRRISLTGALTLRRGEAALHQSAGDHDTVAGGQALGHVLGGRAEFAGVEVGGLAVLPVAGLGVAAARGDRDGHGDDRGP